MRDLNSRPGISRRAARACACVAVLALSHGPSTSAGIGLGKSGPDVAMTEDTLFVSDLRRGKVFQGPVKPGRTSIGEMAPISALADLKQPVALDARGTRLVVIDAVGPRIVDLDLRTGTAKVLLSGSPLREPSGIAIAAGGSVAVADPAARALFLVNEAKEVQIDRRFTTPLQVEFDPTENGLYVYDGERGLLRVEYSSAGSFERAKTAQSAGITPLTGISRVLSFAPRRGLLYVAEESGMRVAVPAKRASLPVPQQFYRRRFTAIAAHTQFIAGIDDAGIAVEVVDRPLPVSVSLDPDQGNPNAAMLAFLDYLATRRLLTARGVETERANEPYEQVLMRYKVLVPTSLKESVPQVDQARVRSLFCALNPRRCGASAGPEGNDDEVAIPQLQVESFLAVSKKALAGKSVQQHIDERVLDPEQRAGVTADYLTRLNPESDQTLESLLRRRNLIMAVVPETVAGPSFTGKVIRLENGLERAFDDLATRCGVTLERESSPTYLPEVIVTREIGALPQPINAEAIAAGALNVDLGLGRAVRETLLLTPLRECRLKPAADKEYVVTEAIKVDGLRYQIHPGGRFPRPSDGRGGGSSQGVPTGWKQLPGRFLVAFKAVEVSNVISGLAEQSVDPATFRPGAGDKRDILRRTEGELNLPETHWRFDALVPAPDFLSSGSTLATVRRGNAALGLSSHERLLTASRSIVGRPYAERLDEDVKAKLAEARTSLLKIISYSEALARGTEDVDVAVGEADGEVNQDHPGFIHGGRSAWNELGPEGLSRRSLPSGTQRQDAPAIHRLVASDHGTHVAGVIAARRSSLVPGLTPSVNLYLVDTAKNLADVIQDAYEKGLLRIFNFSFAIKADQDIDEIKNRMVQHWRDALFVAAAGNEGTNLNAGGSQPLISWVLEAPNILGVGATTADGSAVLGDHPDPADPAVMLKGSNFGSKFVQIVAPGQDVYSLGDQQYAFATGTSQAVPQVTAAAAMLHARGRTDPLRIKARLIASSDWREQYRTKVWGGLLNVERAIMHLEQNVVWTQTAPKSPRAITLDGNGLLTIRGARTYRSDGSETLTGALPFPVRRILRLNHLGSGNFRVIGLGDHDSLMIVFGRVEGKIRCTDMSAYDETAERFGPLPANATNLCAADGIPVNQINDYVAKFSAIPAGVKF
jgi:subtilisin family serine protease